MPGMSQTLHLVAHPPTAELERLYKAAATVIERSHRHVIWLLSRGFAAKLVADVTGFTPRWISELVGRYNQFGLDGLGDGRRFNAGAKSLLDQEKLALLRHWLDGAPPGHGLWTGRKVAQWITGTIGRLVSPRRGLDSLHRLDFTRQRPRPRHAEGNLSAQVAFKAGFRQQIQDCQHADPETPLEVWALDEHRIGLKPVVRRIWAPRGGRPEAVGHHRFAWLYLFGFVRPARCPGSWPTASTPRCSARSWRPSPARSAPVRTSAWSSCSTGPAGMSQRTWRSHRASN
jgi:transposase